MTSSEWSCLEYLKVENHMLHGIVVQLHASPLSSQDLMCVPRHSENSLIMRSLNLLLLRDDVVPIGAQPGGQLEIEL